MEKREDGMRIDGVEGLVKLGLGALFGMAVLAGAANFPYRDPAGARDTLQNTAALTNVEIQEGRVWFAGYGGRCTFRTKFKAANSNGQEVKGFVCKGLFGSQTSIVYKK
jgi:hypothetical protein